MLKLTIILSSGSAILCIIVPTMYYLHFFVAETKIFNFCVCVESKFIRVLFPTVRKIHTFLSISTILGEL